MSANNAELEDSERFLWIAKHFTRVEGCFITKDGDVKNFALRCDDDAPMGDKADANRLRAAIDGARNAPRCLTCGGVPSPACDHAGCRSAEWGGR